MPSNEEREALGWHEAAEYAPGDPEAQDDFMTGWRTADRTRQGQITDAMIGAARKAAGNLHFSWAGATDSEVMRAALEAAEEARRGGYQDE